MNGGRSFLIPVSLGIVLGLASLQGCQFLVGQEETVSCLLPQFPRSWLGRGLADGFEIVYTQNGKEVRHSVSSGSGTIELSLSLGQRTPLVVYPYMNGRSGKVSLYPAGGLYPDFFRSSILLIQWEDGFAAETLLVAARGGFPLDSFNCARFFEEARKRGGLNPWELNQKQVLETLASGSFRADRIVLKKKFSIALTLSTGDWFSKNLLEPSFTVGEEGIAFIQGLPWGIHHYWSLDRSLTLHLSENGRVEATEYRWQLGEKRVAHDFLQEARIDISSCVTESFMYRESSLR
ncbi:MAG: hypothetical protein N2442_12400 [Spirochaetes bacterium]|nr:hypothetical protein [Spirochaetota bacterium]